MSKRVLYSLLVVAGSLVSRNAVAQGGVELAFADPQPHFVAAWAPKQPREAERSAVLIRRVSLELADVTLDAALKTLTNKARLHITYSSSILPAGKRVTISAGDIAVVTALTEILFRSGLDVVVDRDGTLALVQCRHPTPRAEVQESGTIVGIVTDRATGTPIAGASVAVEGARRSGTTNTDGSYRIGGIAAGTYTVRARYIGYAPLETSVVVPEGGEARADFGLEKSTQKLDELVTVAPGGMQTEMKAVPTPVTVITAEDIERQRPATLANVFRQAVPSGVSPNLPESPVAVRFSVRGASSLSGLGVMKVFVDGVEVSASDVSAIDPTSVDRIEVIRGPQAATVYGADAAGGVVQITTKRGDAALDQPAVEMQALAGAVQTPYKNVGSAFRQQYVASLRGSGENVGYNLGGSYTRLGDWLPDGEISRQSNPSVYGSARYSGRIIAADLHARYSRNNVPVSRNPDFLSVGLVSFSRPQFTPQSFTNETYGARISVQPSSWWRNQLTLGADRIEQNQLQAQRRLTTPEDTLFQVYDDERRKVSLFFNSSVTGKLGTHLTGSLTAGVDYYRLEASTFFTANALSTEGTLETVPSGAFTESRATATNTGYFAQSELNWRETLFFTAGLRADQNSEFGADLSTPVSPRFGLSAVHQVGGLAVKVRGAYGRAIRAPSPGAAFASVGTTLILLANPLLAPERQSGWDGGVDLVFGTTGSLSVTGFTQTAKDLIAFLQVEGGPPPNFQYQNVGRVSNRGVEVEATLSAGSVLLKGQYAYVKSRVEELGPGISSGAQVQVGDRPLGARTHTAGASLTATPWKSAAVTAGVTYIGSVRQVDFLSLFRCFGGTGPCQPTQRGYVMQYPGFAKVNLAVTQRVTRQIDAVLAIDNLTNNFAFEGGNIISVMGRITMVGLRAHF